ncbi:TIGR01244 family sulfur transferase [Celeribacter sp.]|uniref:TIGR01244 family sulfur transferase n=1 Tax=Celeribacter sp. TaxID=1890673 RepID=UPI003A93DD5E
MDFNTVNDGLTVSGQITLEEVQILADKGFRTVIDNRPDEEVEGALQSEAMAQAVKAAGLNFLYLPIYPGQFTGDLIDETKKAFAELDGPIYAYCRSGTRSVTAWALSQAGEQPAGDIMKQAAGAGYDLSAIAGYLSGR